METVEYQVVWRGDLWRESAPPQPTPPQPASIWGRIEKRLSHEAVRELLSTTVGEAWISSMAIVAKTGVGHRTVQYWLSDGWRAGRLERIKGPGGGRARGRAAFLYRRAQQQRTEAAA